MKRREFSAAALGMLGSFGAWAQRIPREGTEYRTLDRPVPVDAAAGKIEVVEFFWYSCRHCNAFEPKLVAWARKLPPDVVLRRVPVAFRDSFVPQQRLYYTLEALGKVEELHGKVYEAIHDGNQPTAVEGQILDFAQKHGLDRARFQELYNSFTVQSKARNATRLQDLYRVDGVPGLGIAGRWYTDGDMAGNMDRALQIVDYLVAEARKAK